MRHRNTATALGILLLFGLAGCAATPSPISDEEYLKSAAGLGSFSSMSTEQLRQYGQDYCDYLREHGGADAESREQAVKTFLSIDADKGGTISETAIVVGHAVLRYCPEFASR